MTFKPTHEFRGLELEGHGVSYESGIDTWIDADNHWYHIPIEQVTKIVPKPQPGEVWKYVGPGSGSVGDLELVSNDGEYFIDGDGDRSLITDFNSDYTKILNADGSPA